MAVQPKVRARGANARMRLVYETTYGVTPADGFVLLPFVSSAIGEERPLQESDLLGQGREMADPTYDVATNTGDIVVPNDARNLWFWLRLMFGDPVSTPSVAADGVYTFSAQPAANSTITINAVVVTFVAAGAAGAQVNIGANLAATLVALAVMLNASATAGLASQTYASDATTLTVTSKTLGVAGNSVTLAASAGSNATPGGATMSGGAVDHVFTSGAQDVPSCSIEIGHPEVPSFSTNFGMKLNQMKFTLQRSGLSTVTCSMIGKGESPPTQESAAPDADEIDILRFAQAGGQLLIEDAATGNVTAATVTLNNNLDPVETIEADGRIGGADPGMFQGSGSLTVLYDGDELASKATTQTPTEPVLVWTNGASSLTIDLSRAFLPVTKKSISGPKGISREYNFSASGAKGAAVVVTLRNDMAAYD